MFYFLPLKVLQHNCYLQYSYMKLGWKLNCLDPPANFFIRKVCWLRGVSANCLCYYLIY